ncbi:TIGR04206 family protein [Halomarina halobia]|uniref:TIGR04206 family protein n=1 Tax=Halomarina halobia TaxID=3033386 RepID=A0ABD6A6I7_9EURY|nr:TIGR04206 family protein [Halomarina sp. PSR21]
MSDRAAGTPNRRLFVLLALVAVPWTAVLVGGAVTLVYPFGLVDPASLHLTTLPDYLSYTRGRIPAFIQAWPIGVALYAAALLSAALGVVRREDPRLTGGLLVLTAVSQLPLVVGFSQRFGYTALPVGTVLLLAVAWWFYRPAVRRFG